MLSVSETVGRDCLPKTPGLTLLWCMLMTVSLNYTCLFMSQVLLCLRGALGPTLLQLVFFENC